MWIVLFLLWYFLIGRNNPKIFRGLKRGFSKIIMAVILLSIFSPILPFLMVLFCVLAPFIVLGILIGKLADSKKDKLYKQSTTKERQQFHVEGKELVKAVPKRKRIVERFNQKWGLNLTKEQIDTMVDASYISVLWEAEIIAMDQEYHSVYEWFKSDTSWLRAYLLAFKVQEISSDFAMQREIVFQAFDQIFREMDFTRYSTRKDMLWALNNRYLTDFDDITFMIAYRFLQTEGRDYDIGNGTIVRNEDKIETLARKYS